MSENTELKAEVARSVEKMRQLIREVGSDKAKSLEMLVAAGILTPEGEFTQRYQPCTAKE